MCDIHTVKAEIVDLKMTDVEYAQALVEGRNPLQEKVFEHTLICAGIDPSDARQVAPLIAKEVRSPEQQAVVKAVWRRWCVLLQRFSNGWNIATAVSKPTNNVFIRHRRQSIRNCLV